MSKLSIISGIIILTSFITWQRQCQNYLFSEYGTPNPIEWELETQLKRNWNHLNTFSITLIGINPPISNPQMPIIQKETPSRVTWALPSHSFWCFRCPSGDPTVRFLPSTNVFLRFKSVFVNCAFRIRPLLLHRFTLVVMASILWSKQINFSFLCKYKISDCFCQIVHSGNVWLKGTSCCVMSFKFCYEVVV